MSEETYDEYANILAGNDPIARLNELALTINEHYFDVGCILYHLKEDDIYKTIDGNKYYSDKHTKWKQFCEDHLSVSYRTAQYWLNLYRYFSDMGISRDKLRSIGWSKAKELIDITDDPSTLDIILTRAEQMTIGELRAFIEDYKVTENATAEVTKFKKFVFNLPAAQSEHAEEIIKAAARHTEGDMNEAFWMIALEWYQRHHPLDEDAERVYLVTEDSLDDNGQVLPEEIMQILA